MSNDKPKTKKRTTRETAILVFFLAVVALVTEIVFANFTMLGALLSNDNKVTINMNEYFGKESLVLTPDEPLVINGIDSEMHNLCIVTGGDDLSYKDLTIGYTDDNFRYDTKYDFNMTTVKVKAGKNSSNCIPLSSYGKVGSLKLCCSQPLSIVSIKFNAIPHFSFGFFGFLSIFAALFCIVFGVWKLPLNKKNEKAVLICGVLLCAFVLNCTAVMSRADNDPLLTNIPESVSGKDQYTQLFDAFHKGQLNLDIDYPVSQLEALENPYDRSERNEYDLHGDFWDRAFYN